MCISYHYIISVCLIITAPQTTVSLEYNLNLSTLHFPFCTHLYTPLRTILVTNNILTLIIIFNFRQRRARGGGVLLPRRLRPLALPHRTRMDRAAPAGALLRDQSTKCGLSSARHQEDAAGVRRRWCAGEVRYHL